MAAPMITIISIKHHEQLIDGLWKRLQEEVAVDVDVTWGGWSTKVHRLLLGVFLSSNKLIKIVPVGPKVELEESASLHSLVEFLYRGQVTISTEDVPQLLKAAKWSNFQLLVDGLEMVSDVNKDSNRNQSGSQKFGHEPEFDQHIMDCLQDHFDNHRGSEKPSAEVKLSVVECDDVTSIVTPTIMICSSKHHKLLVDGLWNRLLEEVEVDVDVTWGGWSLRAHRLMLDVFLSPEKLIKAASVGQEVELEESPSLQSLLEFLYRGQVTIQMEEVPQLLKVAKCTNFQLLVDALEKVHMSDLINQPLRTNKDSSRVCRGSPESGHWPDQNFDYQDHDINSQEREMPSVGVALSVVEHDDVTLNVIPKVSKQAKVKNRCATKKLWLPFQHGLKSRTKADKDKNASLEGDQPCGSSTVDLGQDCQENIPQVNGQPSHDGISKATKDGAVIAPKHRASHMAGKRHCCTQCNFTTRFGPSALLMHIRETHLLEKPFECDLCQRKFSRAHNLRRHLLQHTNERPYKCDECELAFVSSRGLENHKFLHSGSKTFKCDQCDELFRNNTSLRYHQVKNHLPEGFIKCKMCLQTFSSKSSLEAHELNHSTIYGVENKHICEICAHTSKSARLLRRHLETHQDDQPFECPVCQKRFKRKFNMTLHQLTHSGVKKFDCDICGQAFSQSSKLKCHRLKHGSNKPETHSDPQMHDCDICDQAFSQSSELKKHQLTHVPDKRKTFQCSSCAKSFTCNGSLKLHEKIHTGNLPHVCKVCGRGFSVKRHMDDHIKTHDKVHPFECSLCPRTFRLKRHLQKHTNRLHGDNDQYSTKVRPFTCPVCHWGFTKKSSLKQHSRLHTGDYPYKCDFCDKRFNQGYHVIQHKRTNHPEKD